MDVEDFYGNRGNSSWEAKMYSEPKIKLDNYTENNTVPLENTQSRGSKGWESLMVEKLSYLPSGRRMGDERSINKIYSNSMKRKVNFYSFNK